MSDGVFRCVGLLEGSGPCLRTGLINGAGELAEAGQRGRGDAF